MEELLTLDRGCPKAGPSRSHSPSRQTGPLGPKELLKACEAVYAGFVPAQVTVDTHLENTLARLNLASEDDACFISQVFYGMVRYKKFLSCLLDSFYYHNRCAHTRLHDSCRVCCSDLLFNGCTPEHCGRGPSYFTLEM